MMTEEENQVGPDRLIPTDLMRTWEREGAVKVRMSKDGVGAAKPVSGITFFNERCAKGGDHPALAVKRNGVWVKWNYNQYNAEVKTAAKALVKLGLERFHAVSVFGFNSPEWFFSSMAAVFAGGISNGLYPTNSAEMNLFIMQDSMTDILIVEDDDTLNKVWDVTSKVDTLKKIVQWTGKPTKPGVLSWEEFMNLGKEASYDELTEIHKTMAINQCATLVYTSGTTANPKGVMLSHDNLINTSQICLDLYKWRLKNEVVISYLPLSHIAGLLFDLWANLSNCSTVYFADKSALRGSLLDYLKEVRPTNFLGVPRVWEKIMEGMLAKGKTVKGLKKKISTACKEAGLQHHLNGKNPPMYKLGQKLIYPKVREALGLDRCIRFYSGAAPLSHDSIKYFLSLDIEIWEVYGMSETSGPHCVIPPNGMKIGSVGPTMPSFKTRLSEPNKDGEGEMCMWGRNIMMGYLGREDKTCEDLDEEGWIHSGDLATIDNEGYVSITGRIKELLITAGGENVAPAPIEDHIKREVPLISNAILIGDKKKFLTVFLTLKTEIDNETEQPTRQLTAAAREWCADIGRKAVTVDDVLRGPDPVIMAAIQAGIDRANKMAVSNAARVQKWTVLPMDLSVDGGELGPTLKLKRFAFNKKYESAVERLYV